MRVLVIGSGGREHAIVWKVAQSKKVKKIFSAPGNAGISSLAKCVDIDSNDIISLAKFAKKEKIDLTIVGPEAPLAKGIVGEFQKNGLRIIGPSMVAAQLESSKSFAKEFMQKFNIPTANYKVFDDATIAKEFIKLRGAPVVVKADGLAGGKGVIIANTIQEGIDAIDRIMINKEFGEDAGRKVVIEEKLEGKEASVFAFTDGTHILPLTPAQDYKKLLDEDKGPNTGGMGSYSPVPFITEEIYQEIVDKILVPTVHGMASIGRKYKGILYAGLMITKEGPKVLEFNVRFGDPETQVILPRLENDIIEVFEAIIDEKLDRIKLHWRNKHAVCVILASGGYPFSYSKGKLISGLPETSKISDLLIFHAGTYEVDGKIITFGGRVLGVTGLGNTLKEAIIKAYQGVNKIKFEGMQYRKDIGSIIK
jgi:phosphoribosylamine--glycine ligase